MLCGSRRMTPSPPLSITSWKNSSRCCIPLHTCFGATSIYLQEFFLKRSTKYNYPWLEKFYPPMITYIVQHSAPHMFPYELECHTPCIWIDPREATTDRRYGSFLRFPGRNPVRTCWSLCLINLWGNQGVLPYLSIEKNIIWHRIGNFLRQAKGVACARVESFRCRIPKSSHPIVLFKYPPMHIRKTINNHKSSQVEGVLMGWKKEISVPVCWVDIG